MHSVYSTVPQTNWATGHSYGGSYFLQSCSRCILQPKPTGQSFYLTLFTSIKPEHVIYIYIYIYSDTGGVRMEVTACFGRETLQCFKKHILYEECRYFLVEKLVFKSRFFYSSIYDGKKTTNLTNIVFSMGTCLQLLKT